MITTSVSEFRKDSDIISKAVRHNYRVTEIEIAEIENGPKPDQNRNNVNLSSAIEQKRAHSFDQL